MRMLALLAVLVPLTTSAQTALSVNPGYWQVTSVVHVASTNLSPTTTHACIQTSDLSQPTKLIDSPYCKTTLTKSTTTSADMTISCKSSGETIEGTLHLDVVSATSVTAKAQLAAHADGNTIPATGDYTAKWLATQCGAVP